MIETLLIANRGEIACRIMQTCRKLGVRTVAVYSDADAKAKHVREADVAVRIGSAPAAESYLNAERILAAAAEAGADAIHPGYGFLSENAEFAEAVAEAGLVWVGPKAETIRAMGLKDEAKRIAEEAGAPVLPGYRGEAQDAKTLAKEAGEIGYPILIKAVAGGGGRGIREVRKASELKPQLDSAVREAKSAFGDGRVMLEKLVERPRHIEVQVFGDTHGEVVHLFERDCSLQRRRQKVIEEAPAPGMTVEVRKAMTEAAVKLAKAVDYQGAGTVEFIVDGAAPLSTTSFWFLEMNTRLQVEHPVTEMVTGLDLVELQLRVAAGEPLGLKQDEIALDGHALEARLCAEDPAAGFLPGAGRIDVFDVGALGPGGRLDTGFEAGDTAPPDYDSMIAKLIVWDESRDAAIARLAESLGETQLAGPPGNVGFLRRCTLSETFRAGGHHVNWIAEAGADLTEPPPVQKTAALAAVADAIMADGLDGDPWSRRDGWRLNASPRRSVALRVGDDVEVVAPDEAADAGFVPIVAQTSRSSYAATVRGDTYSIRLPEYGADAESVESGDAVMAPMPGKLISVTVAAGDAVEAGQALAVMEAMKMEHTLASPRAGVVAAVSAEPGAQLIEGAEIVALVPEDA
ncbi:MAG: biotin carboxylase N-terminal domain-containing protein [Pseudomonadota bacterium]